MITFLIILAEICFWIFILAGLVTRYILKKEKLSIWLLGSTPLIDLLLLVFTVIDLKSGGQATFVHALAAIYIGVSIAFGKQMITWADRQFKYYVLKIDERPGKLYGVERGKKEIEGFFRHVLAYLIGAALLMGMHYLARNSTDTEALLGTLRTWSVVLGIDFLISFSYYLFPNSKKEKVKKV
ncbi:hypothetical protein IMZ08_04150 [Bacillus luteolus]|uniref:Integral inner membrane protein n=1 Tax=Litchfieldia luteola TaxID=682179 RepID=A0ABR9QFH7_9BACI|nr:hypothetical protein [Cytobacillus luteolus]MBE4907251.1 hypothetical protein [Cytobacillus luteolus]MBP1943272.1 uncharacterized membrane protein YraQ (UPF0718 family) [Cytobacillus luteolus]